MNAVTTTPRPSLIRRIAGRYDVDPDKLLDTLTHTVLKTEKKATPEQLMAILIVADRYMLDPFTREIFAFEDKRGGIVPVVSVDGWTKVLNDHPQFDGLKFDFGPDDEKGLPTWCECTIYRKDRSHPVIVREYMTEVRRDTGPWKSHPRRLLRHKTLIQAARVAMGFAGIFDEDEAARIAAGESVIVDLPPTASRTEQAKALLSKAEPAPPDEDERPPLPEADELGIADERAVPPSE